MPNHHIPLWGIFKSQFLSQLTGITAFRRVSQLYKKPKVVRIEWVEPSNLPEGRVPSILAAAGSYPRTNVDRLASFATRSLNCKVSPLSALGRLPIFRLCLTERKVSLVCLQALREVHARARLTCARKESR